MLCRYTDTIDHVTEGSKHICHISETVVTYPR